MCTVGLEQAELAHALLQVVPEDDQFLRAGNNALFEMCCTSSKACCCKTCALRLYRADEGAALVPNTVGLGPALATSKAACLDSVGVHQPANQSLAGTGKAAACLVVVADAAGV